MSIVSRQNDYLQIRRLAAVRNLYARAKSALAWNMVLSVPIGMVLVFVATQSPDLKMYGVAYAMFAGLICDQWLDRRQKKYREMGAKVQEAFDCEVLALPWNKLKAGEPVSREDEIGEAEKYKAWEKRMPPLTNWYSTHVDRLPIEIGRVCCQRANCWWDVEQRRNYARISVVVLIVLVAVAIMVGLLSNLNFVDVLIGVFAPLYPAARLCLRQFREHSDAADRLDVLMKHASALFDEACKDPTSALLLEKSRELQNEIFEGRKKNPPVFDWVFKRLRDKNERQMYASTEDLAREAEKRLGLKDK